MLLATRPIVNLARRALIAAGFAALSFTAQANPAADLLGKTPSRLLQENAAFNSAVGAMLHGVDLPAWTAQLSLGFPAETVRIGEREYALTSACNPDGGCGDERLYLLFRPAGEPPVGFFFLPPSLDTPGDHRMAFSRWIGAKPSQPESAFLMERAISDSLEKDPAPAK